MASLPPASLGPAPPLSDKAFPLAHPLALTLKYNNSGLQLPTTLEEFRKENGLPLEIIDEFKPQINNILTIHKNIKEHTTGFKTNILPSIITIGSDIYNYSRNGNTYYNLIYSSIETISKEAQAAPPDEAKIEKAKAKIEAIIPDLQKDLNTTLLKIQPIIPHLRQFQSSIKKDLSDLKAALDKLHKDLELGDIEGEIYKIQKKIDDLRAQIAKATKEYEDTIGKIDEIPKWGWIPYIGWITAAILKEQWIKSAIALAKKIAEDKSKLDKEQSILESRKTLAIRGPLEGDLQNLIAEIEELITALISVQGALGAQNANLFVVATKVAKDIHPIGDIITDTSSNELLAAWTALAKRADYFRQFAYISTFDPLDDPTLQQSEA